MPYGFEFTMHPPHSPLTPSFPASVHYLHFSTHPSPRNSPSECFWQSGAGMHCNGSEFPPRAHHAMDDDGCADKWMEPSPAPRKTPYQHMGYQQYGCKDDQLLAYCHLVFHHLLRGQPIEEITYIPKCVRYKHITHIIHLCTVHTYHTHHTPSPFSFPQSQQLYPLLTALVQLQHHCCQAACGFLNIAHFFP